MHLRIGASLALDLDIDRRKRDRERSRRHDYIDVMFQSIGAIGLCDNAHIPDREYVRVEIG